MLMSVCSASRVSRARCCLPAAVEPVPAPHQPPDEVGVGRALQPEGPDERPASFGEVEARGRGCRCAPRPGAPPAQIGGQHRGGAVTTATMRISSVALARSRHPTQVRTGDRPVAPTRLRTRARHRRRV